jgi:hypothetical protein
VRTWPAVGASHAWSTLTAPGDEMVVEPRFTVEAPGPDGPLVLESDAAEL